MSADEINIAIAEHCGWKFAGNPELDAYTKGWSSHGKWAAKPGTDLTPLNPESPKHPELVFRHNIPNYAGDLNAMHEAERSLADRRKWVRALATVTGVEFYKLTKAEMLTRDAAHEDDDPMRKLNMMDLVGIGSATAAQRAEAFLRTVGKWKEAA